MVNMSSAPCIQRAYFCRLVHTVWECVYTLSMGAKGMRIYAIYTIRGSQFGQSEEPEVRGIWPEVGGKPLSVVLLF